MEWAVHLLLFFSGLALGVAVSSILWGRHLEQVHRAYRDLLIDKINDRSALTRRLASFDAQPWGLEKVAQARKEPPPPPAEAL